MYGTLTAPFRWHHSPIAFRAPASVSCVSVAFQSYDSQRKMMFRTIDATFRVSCHWNALDWGYYPEGLTSQHRKHHVSGALKNPSPWIRPGRVCARPWHACFPGGTYFFCIYFFPFSWPLTIAVTLLGFFTHDRHQADCGLWCVYCIFFFLIQLWQ